MPRSHVIKRSISVAGHRTSISLEDAFWDVLKSAATSTGRSIASLIAEVDKGRPEGANLSSSLRLFVLDHVQTGRGAKGQGTTKAQSLMHKVAGTSGDAAGEEADVRTQTIRPVVCTCGHTGALQCSEHDLPRHSLWEQYFLDGFSGQTLTVTSFAEMPRDLLGTLNPTCPECGQTGRVRYAPRPRDAVA